METEFCPRCGTQCYKNTLGEWVCPNCGIVSGQQKLLKHKDKPDYV